MSLVKLTLYPNFSDKKNSQYAFFRSYIHSKQDQNLLAKFQLHRGHPTNITHFIKSTPTLNKTLLCVTRPITTNTVLESDNKWKWKGGSWVYETNLFWFLGMHVLGACAPFTFDQGAVWVTVALAFLNGFGVTLGYHRLLTHRGFKVPKWLEYFFAYCGAHALQRDPIVWVSTHKLHHRHADTKMDPHTPTQGVWFSHIGWFLYNDYVTTKCGEYSNVSELKTQRFYRFLHDTYFWHPTALALLLYLCGGFPYLAWGMGMRITVLHLVTYIESTVNHLWGERPWNTPDASTNNWWVAMLCLGEGWHNNHHAFPKSARHGLEWWQLDLTWELIKCLEVVGLASDVKLPTKADKERMASLSFKLSTKLTNEKEALIDLE